MFMYSFQTNEKEKSKSTWLVHIALKGLVECKFWFWLSATDPKPIRTSIKTLNKKKSTVLECKLQG